MGRGKHCTEEKRDIIQKLIKDGKSYRVVGRLVGCLNKMIKNALNYKEKRGASFETADFVLPRTFFS